MRAVLLALLRAYQRVISPLFGQRCRYLPSCSEYAHECVARHGAARGSWLALRRLARCHPFGGSGLDPVPPKRAGAQAAMTQGPQTHG